jgi:hydrogenase assembly chaperone HypC/HupF
VSGSVVLTGPERRRAGASSALLPVFHHPFSTQEKKLPLFHQEPSFSHQVCVTLLPGLKVGEYVIVHTGYAIEKMKADEAKKTIALFEEMAKMEAEMDK